MPKWLIRLLFVLVILMVLCFVLDGACTALNRYANLNYQVARVDQIAQSCKFYAQNHGGDFPTRIHTGAEFTNSTDAFNELIVDLGLGTEEIFYRRGDSTKTLPNQDGILTRDENCFVYVVGLTKDTPPNAPLIAEEMVSPGVYGPNHPWLKDRKVIVGYCGGQVKIERLSGNGPGATVLGSPESGMTNIFLEDTGQPSGGLLPVPLTNILLP